MKMNLKGAIGTIKNDGIELLELGAGAIASKKFLDLEKMLPNANPDSYYIKNQGIIKFVAALVLPGMLGVKNKHISNITKGIAFEGMLQAARQYTTNKTSGKAFFEPLGELEEMDGADDYLAAYVDQDNEGVAGGLTDNNPFVTSEAAVAGYEANELNGDLESDNW